MELELINFSRCRLCASDSLVSVPIFSEDDSINDISSLINENLPLKVEKDGTLPDTICSSCNSQLFATVNFFEKIRNGQDRLHVLYRQVKNEVEIAAAENVTNLTVESVASAISSSNASSNFKVTGSPKRRGRPPKDKTKKFESISTFNLLKKNFTAPDVDPLMEPPIDLIGGSRTRRKRQLPLRYQEAVQDQELDLLIKEEVISEPGVEANGSFYNQSKLGTTDEISPKTSISQGNCLAKKVRRYNASKAKQVYVCNICGQGFVLKSVYLEHRREHIGSVIECTSCRDTFLKEESFKTHCLLNPQCVLKNNSTDVDDDEKGSIKIQMTETKKQNFVCELCKKIFQHEPSFALHHKAVHEDQKPFICTLCDKSFNAVYSLKTHLVHLHKKKTKGYPCEVCGKVFNHPSSVLYHREAEHAAEEFNCDKCDRNFKHKQLLVRHQLVHTNLRPFVCDVCNAAFKTKPNLVNHQATHTGEKKHVCEICGQQFAHKTSLKLHYRWHAGQKPFKCDTCDKAFSQKGNLQEHMRIHTGEKPFACDYCDRKFTTSSQFKLHVKRHVGDRPWQCDICPKTFLHRDTWKCHIRRHRGEKPFACTYCEREFSEQWALKKHLRLHTGEKPYSCEICHKTFSDCSNLTKHKKVHEKVPKSKKDDKIDLSVWKLIKNHLESQGGDKTVSFSADKDDNMEQIIYVTYDDASNTVTGKVINDGSVVLPDDLDSDTLLDDGLTKSIQMTDEMGNPVHFAMLDGGELQLTSGADGQALQVVTQDGHTIPVQITNIDEQSQEPSRFTLQLSSPSLPNLDPITTKATPTPKTKRIKTSVRQNNPASNSVQPSPQNSCPLLSQQLRSNISKKFNINFISTEGSKSLLATEGVETSSPLLSRESQPPMLPSTSISQKTSTPSLLQNLNRNLPVTSDYLAKQTNVTSFDPDTTESILLTHTDGSTSLLQSSALSDKGPADGVLTIDEADPSQSIEFTVEGQKLRMMTSYNLVPMQIPVEYLNMN